MNIAEVVVLLEQYVTCPNCSNELLGPNEGTLVVDEDTFHRSCKCGWKVTIKVK